jgi:tetratricopeptide (TPR) repeat protein
MTPTTQKHDDRKILLVIAGAVVAGAAGLAFLANLSVGDEVEVTRAAPQPRSVQQVATAEPAVFLETPATVDPAIETASLQKIDGSTVTEALAQDVLETATSTFEITPGENLVAGGLTAWQERDYPRSAAYFAAQTEARDGDAWSHYMLGLSLWKSDRADEAVISMRRSAELDPAFIRTPINLSRIENDRGAYQAALEAAQAALVIDENDAEARFLEGRSWNNLGRTDEAVSALEQSLALDDTNGYAHNLLGLILLAEGDSEPAADALERAAELEPDVPFIQNNLGMALEHCGDRTAAVAAYRQAVSLDAGFDKAVRNLARLEPATPEITDETTAAVSEPESEEVEAAEAVEEFGEVTETADAGTLN